MKISAKALETCIDALEILVENSEDTVVCILGQDLEMGHLKDVVAAGADDDGRINEDEIGDIQELINRREALAELKTGTVRPAI